MLDRMLFRKPKNELEGKAGKDSKSGIPDEMCIACPKCKKTLIKSDIPDNFSTCSYCGYNFRMNARRRIKMIADKGSFSELNAELVSTNPLNFPGYDEKLENARLDSSENEGVVCGICTIDKSPCALFVMDGTFIMGSMGSVIGEKITSLFETASDMGLPVVGYSVSGGARMQEGILSLMQMAKVSGAVKRHSDSGGLYVSVLTDPTTGGVTASFAMEGDIIIAEPGALICFAGPRVIEQTIRQKLPAGFQRSEFLLKCGFIDEIVPRKEQKAYLSKILKLHERSELD